MASLILPGNKPVSAIKIGSTDVKQIRIGSQLYWSKATISDGFDLDGALQRWINELKSGDLGALFTDITGTLIDGLGNVVGSTIAFVEGGVNGLGTLVNKAGTNLINAYCGVFGGTAAPTGLIGLINGIPIFGPFLADFLSGTLDIQSIIGKIPLVNKLAEFIGLLPSAAGHLADPINFVVDALGNVIGTLSCGAFKPTGGASELVGFVIGVVSHAAKMLVPDGLLSLNAQTSRVRHPDLLPGDDGYVEVQIAELGSPGFVTQAFRRYANNGQGKTGVGMDFRDSTVSIVRRLAGADALVAPNLASYSPADTLRLTQLGNVHALTKNGEPVGAWSDNTGTAAKGASNLSIAMRMDAAKEMSGSRLFSPSLNYIEAA